MRVAQGLLLASLASLIATHAVAAPSFEAVCKQTGSSRYEFAKAPGGGLYKGNGWSDDPTSFPTKLSYTKGAKAVEVSYGGSETFMYPVFAQSDESIMFLTLDDDLATNANVFALSLAVNKLVYSHAQLIHTGLQGVMGRVFSFDCSIRLL